MLSLGTTRVETGVQTVYDNVLDNVARGHSVKDIIDATRIIKDSGLKVCYHMMPGLPDMTPEKDLEAFRRLWAESEFRPDMLKIYPTLVIKGTKLYDDWKAGKYKPYTTEEAIGLIAEIKRSIPRWVRVQRIQRDIPAFLIEAGVNKSHLRMMVKKQMGDHGIKCQCIRCREIGLLQNTDKIDEDLDLNRDITLSHETYDSSEGKEHFISFESKKNDLLIAYARLRFPSKKAHRAEICTEKASLLRELKVFGEMVGIDDDANKPDEWQHRGFGKKLLEECENISRTNNYSMILVNSGIGVKPYYVKLGYKPVGVYMGKAL
jgi:elongator complex protein 3